MKTKYFKTEDEAICSVLEPIALQILREQNSGFNEPLYFGDREEYADIFGKRTKAPFFAYYQDTVLECGKYRDALESAIWLVKGEVPFVWTRQVGKKWEAGLSNYDD